MAIYAAFGLAAGIFTFAGTFIMYVCGIKASYALFNEALEGVMRSKVEWFDTTPLYVFRNLLFALSLMHS